MICDYCGQDKTENLFYDDRCVSCVVLQYQARIRELREALAFYADGEHWEWNDRQMGTRILLDVGTKAAYALDRPDDLSALEAYVAELLERIRNYDKVIQAVATALGGVCCGGIDVEGPGSTKDVLVGAIEKLRDLYDQRGLYLQDAEVQIRKLTILAGENLP